MSAQTPPGRKQEAGTAPDWAQELAHERLALVVGQRLAEIQRAAEAADTARRLAARQEG